MFTKSPLRLAIAALIAAPISAQAEVTVSAEIKNETAFWVKSDQATGEARRMLDEGGHDSGDVMKFENSARIFINGDLGEDSTWHAELRPVYDTEAPNEDLKGHKLYSQNDYLRELYADTSAFDWDFRIGKQQVVWGTADGIKLLDIINPTDFRELNQNGVEDARIPVWMVNAEHYFDNGSNLQLIVSQAEENKYAGLNKDGDSGSPFIASGVDAITGRVNGFLNIAPALANVATTFTLAEDFGGFGGATGIGLVPFTNLNVEAFSSTTWNITSGALVPAVFGGAIGVGSDSVTVDNPTAENGFVLLNLLAQDGIGGFAPVPPGTGATLQNNNETNVMAIDGSNEVPTTVSWLPVNKPTSAFEHMPNATFATFNTFSGNNDPAFFGGSGGISGLASHGPMTTRYVRDYPDDENVNAGFRWRNTTDGGLNYSLNYFYHYDANPVVDLSYHDAVTGEELVTELRARGTVLPNPGFPVAPALPDGPLVSRNSNTLNTAGGGATVLLRNSSNQYYGATNPDAFGTLGSTLSPNGVELRFTESLNRIHSLGASFDYAFATDFAPVVLRGEFLYDQDTMQPVVDKRLLSIGDLEGALRPEEADFFKYVIGVDVTVWTNLLISGQFIQFRNLDFEEDKRVCTTSFGQSFDCSRYTADSAVLNVTNSLEKARENKEFYSLFLSKPFGPNQLGRVNNIIIFEEGGGYWNRLDAEYSLTDQLIVSGQLNYYWGDEETQFGQFENSSNIQFGVRYIIE